MTEYGNFARAWTEGSLGDDDAAYGLLSAERIRLDDEVRYKKINVRGSSRVANNVGIAVFEAKERSRACGCTLQ